MKLLYTEELMCNVKWNCKVMISNFVTILKVIIVPNLKVIYNVIYVERLSTIMNDSTVQQ